MKLKLTDGRYELLDATDRPLPDAKLSQSNCHAIALGYDLEEIKNEYIQKQLCNLDKDAYERYLSFAEYDANIFIKGYNKALEDRRYTEDDLKRIFIQGSNWTKDESLNHDHTFGKAMSNAIQSLNEWSVCIEQEPHNDFVDDGNTHIISARPKLDATGCLILKRI